ncbi:MAG: autotransporter domain-containing protein [Pseudomonadota bacterium]
MLHRFSILIIISITSLVLPKLAHASYPDVTGSYTGTLFGIDVDSSPASCPENGMSFNGALSITLASDTNGNITGGNGTFINNTTGETDNFTVDGGSFFTQTDFSISVTLADGSIGGLIFSLASGTLNVVSGTINDINIECDSVITGGTLNLVSGGTTFITAATPSSSVTDALLFNLQISGTVAGISNRIAAALASIGAILTPRFGDSQFHLNGMTGLNAGDGNSIPYGVWGNYSYTDFENDLSSTAIDGSSHGFLGGIDFQIWSNTVLGVAFGYDNSDIDTSFNQGNQSTDTITIAPYFGAILSDTLSLDFNIGYSNVSYDQFRTAGTTRVTSSPNSDRWFGSFNLNTIHFIDNWILGGRAGMLYALSEINDYTESNGTAVAESRTKVTTISLAGDIAYSFQEWEPFINLSYQYDVQLQEIVASTGPQPSNDNDDILITTGLRYFESSGISGNLEYSKRLLRDDYDEDRISLTFRVDY